MGHRFWVPLQEVPVLSQSTSSDLLWDACAQALALFCLVVGFLC